MPRGYGNFSYVVDSSFQPFSMQEMLTPFMAYKEAYEQNEAAYMDLTDKADKFKYLSKTLPEGSQARQIYEGYANDLKAQAEDLASSGLTMGNRRALTGLKRRYQGEIGRLAEADMRRRTQIAEQQKIALQDPTRIFSRDASLSTIDDYLDNPDLSYKSYSGALLTQQVGQAASNLAKQLRDQIKTGRIDAYTKTWMEERGFDAADVLNAIEHPNNMTSSKARILNALVDDAVKSSRVGEWGNNEAYEAAKQYARQGLWNSIGQTQVHSFADYAAQKELDFNYKMREADEAAKRMQNQAQNLNMNINPKFDRRNVRTTAEIAADIKDKEMLQKYGKYFYRKEDGTYAMNYEGRKKYKESPYSYKGAYSTALNAADTEFKEWIDSRGLSEMAKGRTGKTQNSILTGIFNRSQNLYDTTTAGEYTGLIDSSQYDNVVGVLNRASNNGSLKNYERRKKGNSYEFVPTDDVDVSKLTNADIKSAVPVYGVHGNFLEVTLKGGDRIIIPYNNLNTNYNGIVSGNVNDAYALSMMKQRGMETFTYSDGRTVPIDVAITDALNQGYDNFMSGLGTSQVEPQKTTRGLYQMR